MQCFRDHEHVGLSTASAVAIGNFDGVHRGHQALIARARERAGTEAKVALVTFEPLPRAWFDADGAPARLTSPANKLRLLQSAGVDLTWMLRFNARLAAMEATDFIRRILVDGLSATTVVVGEDFRFGHRRAGDVGMLREMGTALGFATEIVEAVNIEGTRISSTRIRSALEQGDLIGAERLLGRPYGVRSRVVAGQQLGRTLGYPTANLRPWGGKTPLSGVFAVQARVEDEEWQDGVASVGVRPAVGGGEPLIEVHLFDCERDLYGKHLEARFIRRLRGEEDFSDLAGLVDQMKQDEKEARRALKAFRFQRTVE